MNTLFNTTFNTILAFHIMSGFTALTIGLVPMLSKKGGKTHKRYGMIYFWAMFGVFCTALPMSMMKGNIFLFTIAIFSFYQTFTGFRHTRIKNKTQIPFTDKLVTWITFLTSIGMISYSAYLFLHSNVQPAVILSVFGTICFSFAISDLKRYGRLEKSIEERQAWYFGHITRMSGSYIATFTAFAVTNLTFVPPMVAWLGPTFIGVILITRSVTYYRSKFAVRTVIG